MLRFRRFALFIFASAITLAAGSAHAALAVTTTTYNFVGACTDCNGFGRAELTLSNYTPGQAIDATNFVAFHYDGTDLLAPFTITAAQATSLLGSFADPVPALEHVVVAGNGQIFSSLVTGFWCTGNACLLDFGATHQWSVASTAVPEPMSAVLVAGSLLSLSMLRRWRAK